MLLICDSSISQKIIAKAVGIDVLFQEAEEYYYEEDYIKAINIYKKITMIDPGHLDSYKRIGLSLIQEEKFLDARKIFLKAHQISPESIVFLRNIGHTYLLVGDVKTAQTYYEQSLDLCRKNFDKSESLCLFSLKLELQDFIEKGWQTQVCRRLKLEFEGKIQYKLIKVNILLRAMNSYYLTHDYERVLLYAKQALEIVRYDVYWKNDTAWLLDFIGNIYTSLGNYDEAFKYYQQALEAAQYDSKILGREVLGRYEAKILVSIGLLYQLWGNYGQALSFFEKALADYLERQRKAETASVLYHIGSVHLLLGEYSKALSNLAQALEYYSVWNDQFEDSRSDIKNFSDYFSKGREFLEKKPQLASCLSKMGEIYQAQGQYEEALSYYQQALEIGQKILGKQDIITRELSNIGTVHTLQKNYEKALEYFEQALKIDRIINKPDDIARELHRIGLVYYYKGKYSEAITQFEESVLLKERLRETAKGEIRRDYLVSQIETYRFLISCYVQKNDISNIFNTVELSRAKLLAEQLAVSNEIKIPNIEQIQQNIPENFAILIYSYSGNSALVQLR